MPISFLMMDDVVVGSLHFELMSDVTRFSIFADVLVGGDIWGGETPNLDRFLAWASLCL
jgi:hypothetical protein